MANIELHRSLFGDGYTGSIESAPALSWLDSHRLERAAKGAMASAIELRLMNGALWDLEEHLGLRLEQQTRVLEAQRGLLAAIDAALRTPAKTRAAERIADTAELLRRGRYERALALAEEAIVDDPNNPAAFRAAGWALLGLGRTADAQRHFVECAAADDGDDRVQALRQAARLAYLQESPSEALALIERAGDSAAELTLRGVQYDRTLYLAESGEIDAARAALRRAFDGDLRFAFMALADPVLERHDGVIDEARAVIEETMRRLRAERAAAETAVDGAIALLDTDDDPMRPGAVALQARLAELRIGRPEDFGALSAALDDVRRSADELTAKLRARSEREAQRARDHEARQREIQRQRELTARRLEALNEAVSKVEARAGPGTTTMRSINFTADVWLPAKLLRSPRRWSIRVDEVCRVTVHGPDGQPVDVDS